MDAKLQYQTLEGYGDAWHTPKDAGNRQTFLPHLHPPLATPHQELFEHGHESFAKGQIRKAPFQKAAETELDWRVSARQGYLSCTEVTDECTGA